MKPYAFLPLMALAMLSCEQGDVIAGHARVVGAHVTPTPVPKPAPKPEPKPVVSQQQPKPMEATVPAPLPALKPTPVAAPVAAPAPKPVPRPVLSQQQPKPNVRTTTSTWQTPQTRRDQLKRDYPLMPGQNRGLKAR